MTVSELYQKTLDDYGCCLQSSPSLTLLSYCLFHHVSIRGIRAWMSRQGLSVFDFKPRSGLGPSSVGSDFAPLHPLGEAPSVPDILYGIHITFPDGVTVSIKEGSSKSINSFIAHYNHKSEEIKLCLR